MKKALLFLITSISILSCRIDDPYEPVYTAGDVHRIPYGGTGTLSSGNYTGQGNVTNVAGTTVNIEGLTTVDALSVGGKVNVPSGAMLIVNDVLNIGGGASIDIKGTLITKTFTQVGNVYLNSGFVEVNGRYTIGGGTTLYIANSQVEVDELVITGHIQGIHNAVTEAANWYSLIELTGNKVLNRGGGTNVCGPILFSDNNDQGSTQATLVDVTNAAVANNDLVKTVYGLPDTGLVYQYDDNCTPLIAMPAH